MDEAVAGFHREGLLEGYRDGLVQLLGGTFELSYDVEHLIRRSGAEVLLGWAKRALAESNLNEILGIEASNEEPTAATRLVDEGRLKARRRLLVLLLNGKFGSDSLAQAGLGNQVAQADEETLALWTGRLLGANTLEEVFEPLGSRLQ